MNAYRMVFSLFLLGSLFFAGSANAAKLFLVSKVVGEVSTRTDSGEEAVFGQARWLPRNTRIFTREDSGVMALTPGFSLRFGQETAFSVDAEKINLHKGAMLAQVLKSGNELVLEGPEASLWLKGQGACLLALLQKTPIAPACFHDRLHLARKRRYSDERIRYISTTVRPDGRPAHAG